MMENLLTIELPAALVAEAEAVLLKLRDDYLAGRLPDFSFTKVGRGARVEDGVTTVPVVRLHLGVDKTERRAPLIAQGVSRGP